MALDSPLVTALVERVERWDGVEAHPHRFGGIEFRLDDREVGHVHANGMLDIPYAKPVRDVLVAGDRTGPHHLFPESGWTTTYLEHDADVERGAHLLRISYLYHAVARGKTPVGRHRLDGIDLHAEYEELALPAEIRERLDAMAGRTLA
jgi:hypothetical protein